MRLGMYRKAITLIVFLFCICAYGHQRYFEPIHTVFVHSENSGHFSKVTSMLQHFGISFQEVSDLNPVDEEHIYILLNLNETPEESLPKYFIAYQTQDLASSPPSPSYQQKLSRAIVIWDDSAHNINTYSDHIYQYHQLRNTEDSMALAVFPFFLPLATLNTYKEILQYSNTHWGDISEHLPAIFCHSLLHNPKVIVEAGVGGGVSTIPLNKASQFASAQLIGIDIDGGCVAQYASLNNPLATFLHLDDVTFCQHADAYLNHQKIDILFIDTSHEYAQTKREIISCLPALSEKGMLIFHDSNWASPDSPWFPHYFSPSVAHALKELFISFDETKYQNFTFTKDNVTWHMVHYPRFNGLTVLKKISG